jgi:hydroxypyruvate reductase
LVLDMEGARQLLIDAFHAGVAAVRAEAILPRHLPAPCTGRNIVIAAGKAAADMAACVVAHWPADAPLEGLALTRHGHGVATRRIEVIEAGHPHPDAAGQIAARRVLETVRSAGPEDQIIALLSGGASSLLSLPACTTVLQLDDLRALSASMLASGAAIAEINCVRKHLSATLGGRLAQVCRAPVHAYLLSDVTGDDPGVIASGPFSPDPTTYADALAVVRRWNIDHPAAPLQYLERGAAGEFAETPKPGDPCFEKISTRVIGNGHTMLEGAATSLARAGIQPVILGDTYTGEAREVAQVFAALAREIHLHGQPWSTPVALLSGGETSVKNTRPRTRRSQHGISARARAITERLAWRPRTGCGQ